MYNLKVMIDDRLRKLLVYMGDEGASVNERDAKKVEEVFNQIMEQPNPIATEYMHNFMVKVITQIPLKHYIYALLTTLLAKNHKAFIEQLIQKVFEQLQTSLNTCSYLQSRNILLYIAELMNFGLINSFIFVTIVLDMVSEAEKCPPSFRTFYLRLTLSVLPMCGNSLSEKVPQDLKKIVEKLKKISELQGNSAYKYELLPNVSILAELLAQNRLKEYSKTVGKKLPEETTQCNPQIKISFKQRTANQVNRVPVEQAPLDLAEEDQLYRQYVNSQDGFLHRQNLRVLFEAFRKSKKVLLSKVSIYVIDAQNSMANKYLIEFLLREALKQQNSQDIVVYTSILVHVCQDIDQQIRKDFRRSTEDISIAIFNQLQDTNMRLIEKFANLLSFYISNIGNVFDWQRWAEGSQRFLKRGVFLKLLFQKCLTLFDKAIDRSIAKPIAAFVPPSKYSLINRQSKEQIAYISKISESLDKKDDAQTIIPKIGNIGEFQMFVECLLTRMSNSTKHLEVLSERYRKVFSNFGHKFEKAFISGINTFWSTNQSHKIEYITFFIEKQIISYEGFIQWLSMEAKVSQEIDKILLRRLYEKMSAKLRINFQNKEMLHELEQSLA